MSTTAGSGPEVPDNIDSWGYRGRRVVVTGAASGMGQAAATILVCLGAEVIGLDIKEVTTDGVARSLIVDLGDPASIATVADSLDGPFDAVFNCAGIPGVADPRTILAINFCGLRALTEALVPKLNPGSAICNIGSTAAVSWPLHVDTLLELMEIDGYAEALAWLEAHLEPLGYPYDVSKEAVNVYTAWRSISLIADGIRINCVNPGGTLTPASRDFSKAVKSKAFGPEMLAVWPKLMGRMAQPHEQAWPMVFLNSPFAAFVNGASIYADAGFTSGLFTHQHHPDVGAGMSWRPPR
jgi:NAD(P)-dependent dehydrogenase (short-subunit alcohol dehydrogenase family)